LAKFALNADTLGLLFSGGGPLSIVPICHSSLVKAAFLYIKELKGSPSFIYSILAFWP